MGNRRRISKLITSQGIGICTILAAIFMANLATYEASAASYVAQYVGASINGTWVKVDSSGAVGIELVPTETGTLGIGKGTVTVETNANTGYRLYLSGLNAESNGYTALYKDGNTSSFKIASIPNPAISPATLTAGQWGYAIPATEALALPYKNVLTYGSTTETSIINSLKFSGVRQEYTQVKTSNSSNVAHPDNIDIYYGAMADNNTPLGSYYNVVVYTAFVEGTDNVAVTPEDGYLKDNDTISVQTNIQDAPHPITADQVSLELDNVATCDHLTITSDGTVGHPLAFSCTFHSSSDTERNKAYDMLVKIDPNDSGIYLSYDRPASWKYGKPLDQLTYMQDVTTADCAVSKIWDSLDDDYILTDIRDDKQYVTRRLKDGRCWMTQNLDLELVNDHETMKAKKLDNTAVALDETNTNIATTWIIPEGSQGYDTQTSDEALYWNKYGCANSGYSEDWTSSDYESTEYCSGYEVRSRRLDDCTTYSGNYNSADTIDACATPTGAADTSRNGVIYNWIAATVGSHGYEAKSGKADYSICPKGWRLPTGGIDGEMHNMLIMQKVLLGEAEGGVAGELTALGLRPYTAGNLLDVGKNRYQQIFTDTMTAPISAVHSGAYDLVSGKIAYRGIYGQFWHSTASSSTSGAYVEFLSSQYYPGTAAHWKGRGFGVRCIAE